MIGEYISERDIEQVVDRIGITVKQMVGVLVSAGIVLIEGILLFLIGFFGIFSRIGWWFGLACLIVGIYMIVVGTVTIVVPILVITGGAGLSLLQIMLSDWYRNMLDYMIRYGLPGLVIVSLVMAILSITAPLWITVSILLTFIASIIMYFYMDTVRKAMQEIVDTYLPI